jgi:hypothetical protein
MQERCLLRVERRLLSQQMNEVFPKKFSEHFFAIIKSYLKVKMESRTYEEWSSV